MSAKNEFLSELERLAEDRSYRLRKAVGIAGRGKAPTFAKTRVKEGIERLQCLASSMHDKRLARDALRSSVSDKRQWHPKAGKGWGRDVKKKSFKQWFQNQCQYPYYIYVFWAGRKCVYVGQSTNGKTRPESHFEKHWFSGVTRLDLHRIDRLTEVGKLECLAIHLWKPSRNKIRPANRKWAKKCPIHAMHRIIEQEMKKMFPIKRGKAKK